MYFIKIIFSCGLFSCSHAFGLFGIENVYKFFLKELNSTIALLDASPISTKWFQQPLDHFDINETRTWKMRYYERLDSWKRKGPIFLYINGEAPASKVFLQTGMLYELAKETNGAMYLAEHRYYGKSKPFKNLTTENLKYLSSKQALADIANLLKVIKTSPKYYESKVVVVGGSYAGNLAAWMRQLYPDLIDAAIASSAPVLAKKNFYEYLETVSDDFEQYGSPGCYDKIAEIFKRYEKLFQNNSGIELLKDEEEICNSTDMTKPENKQLFFLDKTSSFMYESQYGTSDSIYNYCEDLSDKFKVVSTKNENEGVRSRNSDCFNYDFDEMIENMKEIDSAMAWTYQTCTEFGYFQTSASESQPFTNNIPVELFYRMCNKMFGAEFDEKRIDEGIERTNNMYDGLHPNVTQVVFVNGDLDPYHRLGILEDVSYNAPAKVISRSSHCRDLLSNKPKDPEELKQARRYIKYLIKKWIGAGDYKNPKDKLNPTWILKTSIDLS